jgi:hypothetical protein
VLKAAFLTEGAEGARRDIAQGHLELRSYGLQAAWTHHYSKLLRERLGVERRGVAGCNIGGLPVDKVDEYNRTMVAEIERRFGQGVLKQLSMQAVIDFVNEKRRSEPAEESEASREIAMLFESINDA